MSFKKSYNGLFDVINRAVREVQNAAPRIQMQMCRKASAGKIHWWHKTVLRKHAPSFLKRVK